MTANALTRSVFFKTIDNCQNGSQLTELFEKYIPTYLYKFSAFPYQKYKKEDRMRQLRNGEIWFSAKDNLNDPFEFEHLMLKTATPEAQKYYNDKQLELEMFCLTASPLNKLMWSHYADSYSGYCVEYRVENKGRIYPVIYDDSLPDMSEYYQRFFNQKETLSNFSFGMDEVSKDILRLNYPLSSKDECWSYEKEYRIIDSIQVGESPAKGHIRRAKDYGLFLSAVIIGANCSSDDEALLKSTVGIINKQEDQKRKKLILNSPYCTQKCRDNIDYYVRTFYEKNPILAPIVLKRLTWNEQLQLTTKIIQENENGQDEI